VLEERCVVIDKYCVEADLCLVSAIKQWRCFVFLGFSLLSSSSCFEWLKLSLIATSGGLIY